MEFSSPLMSDNKKNYKKERNYTIRSDKEQPKLHAPLFANKDYYYRFQTESQTKNNIHSKLKSQTKISQNLFKIPERKIIHRKNRAQSIDLSEGKKVVAVKKNSPKKISSPKKTGSPKKLINSMKIRDDLQFSKMLQKYTDKL